MRRKRVPPDGNVVQLPVRQPLTRLTVNLTARSVAALDMARDITKDTRTDVVNRALQVYAFIVDTLDEPGVQLRVRRVRDGEETDERITIL